jgi:hypothetical protein
VRLYHGTNGAWLDVILKQGLKPRGANGRTNWTHTINSNPRCVYLTDSYAPYFAFNATRGKEPICAVVEIDTDLLDEANLYPDEDFLEQISRDVKDPVPGDMKARTLHFRKHQFDYDYPCINPDDGSDTTWWQASLRYLGTASHRGIIPASAITRAVRWPHKANAMLRYIWDPTITTINQKIFGDKYKTLTAKLFAGEFTTAEEAKRLSDADPWGFRESHPLPEIEGWEIIRQQIEARP